MWERYRPPAIGEFDAAAAVRDQVYCAHIISRTNYVCTLPRWHGSYYHVAHTFDNRVLAVEYTDPALQLPEGL